MWNIPGFENVYSISFEEKVYNKNKKKYKTVRISEYGYKYVELWLNGKKSKMFIHRIFALLFIPNPCNLATVNHKNGNKLDNSIDNLEWASLIDNTKHAHSTGLIKQKGINSSSCKLTEDQVLLIRTVKETDKYYAARFNVSESTITHARQRRNWKHI